MSFKLNSSRQHRQPGGLPQSENLVNARYAARRRGVIAVKAALVLVPMTVFVAFVIDMGVRGLTLARLQQAADAGAISAALRMVHNLHPTAMTSDQKIAADTARSIVAMHQGASPGQQLNLPEGDVEFLRVMDSPGEPPAPPGSGASPTNAVRITVRRDAQANGPLGLSFGAITGAAPANLNKTATAAYFPAAELGEGADILPIAVDATVWGALRAADSTWQQAGGTDITRYVSELNLLSFLKLSLPSRVLDPLGPPFDLNGNPLMIMDQNRWHSATQTVSEAPDGIWESLFLPQQFESVLAPVPLNLGAKKVQYLPGNMVLLDLGPRDSWKAGMNLARIERQIMEPISKSDIYGLNELNGIHSDQLAVPFVAPGQYELPKQLKHELTAAIGKPRILFLYSTVPGAVSTVQDLLDYPSKFVITGWVGAVITDVNFDSLLPWIKFQPASYSSFQLKRSFKGDASFASGVYAGPYLIR